METANISTITKFDICYRILNNKEKKYLVLNKFTGRISWTKFIKQASLIDIWSKLFLSEHKLRLLKKYKDKLVLISMPNPNYYNYDNKR